MIAKRRPRYGLMAVCLVVAVLAGVVAISVSTWALVALPFAFIIGACALIGLSLGETWDALGERSGDDVGRGPAGMGP